MTDGTVAVVATVPKNISECYRLSIRRFRGSTGVDLRVFWRAPDDSWKPSRKGIWIILAAVPEIIAALEAGAGRLLEIQAEEGGSREPTEC